jgi:hypothetical protein
MKPGQVADDRRALIVIDGKPGVDPWILGSQMLGLHQVAVTVLEAAAPQVYVTQGDIACRALLTQPHGLAGQFFRCQESAAVFGNANGQSGQGVEVQRIGLDDLTETPFGLFMVTRI